jgi:endoglucanase
MKKSSRAFLEQLMSVACPSGFEEPAQALVRAEFETFADTVSTDVHGNVIAAINPDAELRVMLAGHCDEIGLMVNYIDDQGYIWFGTIGGIDPIMLPGQRVRLQCDKGPVIGAIGKKPIHLMESDERGKNVKITDLWIDIGAKDKKDAEKRVSVGDIGTVIAGFEELQNDIVISRAFDDRIGSFTVIEALRRVADSKKKPKVGVFAVSTVQEEVGLRGAKTSAYGVDPHVGIAVDVGFASDFPTVDKKIVGDIKLGEGPILHRGCNINPVVARDMEAVARKAKIPYQMQAEPRATGTDANVMQTTRAGVATSLISIPNRYMHTPVEAVSLKDVDNASKLIAEYVLTLTAKSTFVPGQ